MIRIRKKYFLPPAHHKRLKRSRFPCCVRLWRKLLPPAGGSMRKRLIKASVQQTSVVRGHTALVLLRQRTESRELADDSSRHSGVGWLRPPRGSWGEGSDPQLNDSTHSSALFFAGAMERFTGETHVCLVAANTGLSTVFFLLLLSISRWDSATWFPEIKAMFLICDLHSSVSTEQWICTSRNVCRIWSRESPR